MYVLLILYSFYFVFWMVCQRPNLGLLCECHVVTELRLFQASVAVIVQRRAVMCEETVRIHRSLPAGIELVFALWMISALFLVGVIELFEAAQMCEVEWFVLPTLGQSKSS